MQCLPDDHQADDLLVALSFVRDCRLAIDCGAHRGTIAHRLARVFDRVVAIEPGPLAERIEGCEVIRAAVSDKPGRCSMADGPENTGQRHVVEGDEVEVITLDSLGLWPDFVKIDVEGLEYRVLLGAEKTIRQNQPIVMLEENGLNRRYGIADGAAIELMRQWGAHCVAVRNKDWIFAWW
ncbi:MAG: FkbM family methyltransferase [Phototrophicaceae bacterium]